MVPHGWLGFTLIYAPTWNEPAAAYVGSDSLYVLVSCRQLAVHTRATVCPASSWQSQLGHNVLNAPCFLTFTFTLLPECFSFWEMPIFLTTYCTCWNSSDLIYLPAFPFPLSVSSVLYSSFSSFSLSLSDNSSFLFLPSSCFSCSIFFLHISLSVCSVLIHLNLSHYLCVFIANL